jgi:hypothetical protein
MNCPRCKTELNPATSVWSHTPDRCADVLKDQNEELHGVNRHIVNEWNIMNKSCLDLEARCKALEAERDEYAVAWANVSGALCDAGDVIVYERDYAKSVRELTAKRDALAARVAERDAKLASLRDWLDSVGDDWTADGLRMFIRDLITDVIDASQAPRKDGDVSEFPDIDAKIAEYRRTHDRDHHQHVVDSYRPWQCAWECTGCAYDEGHAAGKREGIEEAAQVCDEELPTKANRERSARIRALLRRHASPRA